MKRKRINLQMSEALLLEMLHLPKDLELVRMALDPVTDTVSLILTGPDIDKPCSPGMHPPIYDWVSVVSRKYIAGDSI